MRIALVHYAAPPVIGGVERVLAQQAKVLMANGHEVVVVCGNEGAVVEGTEVRVVKELAAGGGGGTSGDGVVGDGVVGRRHVGSPWSGGTEGTRGDGVGGDEVGHSWRADVSSAKSFLDKEKQVVRHRHVLPHWHQDGVYVFVTWRLADSLPENLLRQLKREREFWMGHHPRPWEAETEREYYRRFTVREQKWLDAGNGECVLRREDCSGVVVDVLRKYDGQRYDLCAFVVMPNHVHVVVKLREGHLLEDVVKGWKEWSAKGINGVLKRSGQVWEVGYFDRLIRNGKHLGVVVDYVVRNPAKLESGFLVWVAGGDGESVGRRHVGSPWKGGTEDAVGEGDGDAGVGRRHVGPPWSGDLVEALSGCEVVMVHNMFTMPFNDEAAEVLAEVSETVRVINWVHDVDVSREWFEGLGVGVDVVHVAVSEARKSLLREKVGVEDCVVVPNGVDVGATLGWSERMEQTVKRHRLLGRELVVFHPARVLARKNMELGVEVVKVLRERGMDAIYVISGAPDPHRASSAEYGMGLRELVERYELKEAVVFLADDGPVDEAEVRSMYGLADVVFFPSKAEGFGLPLVEAALHGVPVLCSDIAPHREVGGGMDGVEFFDLEESAQAVADRLLMLVKQKGRAAQARREAAARFDWNRIYEDYLERVLKKR